MRQWVLREGWRRKRTTPHDGGGLRKKSPEGRAFLSPSTACAATLRLARPTDPGSRHSTHRVACVSRNLGQPSPSVTQHAPVHTLHQISTVIPLRLAATAAAEGSREPALHCTQQKRTMTFSRGIYGVWPTTLDRATRPYNALSPAISFAITFSKTSSSGAPKMTFLSLMIKTGTAVMP